MMLIQENITLNNNGIFINFRFQNYFANPPVKTGKSAIFFYFYDDVKRNGGMEINHF